MFSQEHVDFIWLKLDDFVEKINGDSDKKILKKVLEKALRKEVFFEKEKIDDFREK